MMNRIMGGAFYFRNILLILFFSVGYIISYHLYLNFYFDYTGFALYKRPPLFIIISIIISIIPILFYRGIYVISSFISVFIYIILYIPLILTFALGCDETLTNIFFIQINFMFGMCCFFLVDRVNIKKKINVSLKFISFRFILLLTFCSTLFIAIKYSSNLKIVSFGDQVYKQRSENSDLGSDLLTRYTLMWLEGFLIPVCLAYGLMMKKHLYFIIGSLSCIVIYAAIAAKGTILLPFIYTAFYILFSKKRVNNFFPIFILSLTSLIIVLLIFTKPDSISFLISSILLARTVGNGGMLTMWYYNFFLIHPHTYFSHINVVNAIANIYPYGNQSLGQVVGRYYWSDDLNANANFWATDGIASVGLWGIGLISIIVSIFFIIVNTITKGYDRLFLILLFIPFVGSLLNTSLFSSLWSGGTIFLLCFLFLNNKRRISSIWY